MATKPIISLELHYTMIQYFIIAFISQSTLTNNGLELEGKKIRTLLLRLFEPMFNVRTKEAILTNYPLSILIATRFYTNARKSTRFNQLFNVAINN